MEGAHRGTLLLDLMRLQAPRPTIECPGLCLSDHLGTVQPRAPLAQLLLGAF